MTGQEALWSAAEVKTQAAQARGQLTVWDVLAVTRECEACGAEPQEPCRPGCIGEAAYRDAAGAL